MDTTALAYFMGIAAGQTFWDVSEECHVSQSSVSKSISRLEADLGIILFNRERRTVSLTPAGEIFYEFLLRTAPEYKKTLHQMAEYTSRKKIVCCVVPSDEILNLNLRVKNSDFAKRHPDISFHMTRESDPEKAAQDLLNEEIDFIIGHRYQNAGNDFENIDLCNDALFVLLPPNHRLAGRPSIDFMELYQETILVRSPTVRKVLLEICAYWRKPAPPNLTFYDVPSSELRRNQIIDMIAFGEGITFFFASDLFPFRLDHVCTCKVTGIPNFPLILQKKAERIHSSSLQTVEDFLISLIPDTDSLNQYHV